VLAQVDLKSVAGDKQHRVGSKDIDLMDVRVKMKPLQA